MPYRDYDMKKHAMKNWRKRVMGQGYGKWLYARRKLRFDDAERFRETLERIIEVAEHGRMTNEDRLADVAGRARAALEESRQAEEALGKWEPAQEERV